jgi:methionyl aminopeptidase
MRPERKEPPPKVTAPADIDAAYAAAQRVVEIHRRISAWLRIGVTLPKVNRFVEVLLDELDCRSCFRGYQVGQHPPFPSQACLSVNDCIVHGTAGYYPKPIVAGDLLKIDIGVFYNGWVGDAVKTYVFGEPSPEVQQLTQSGKEAIHRGIRELQPGRPLAGFARAVQNCVEGEYGFFCTRGLGGHGYGRKLHEPPYVSNSLPEANDDWPEAMMPCEPGMLLAVEPMIAASSARTRVRGKSWQIFTEDGSKSVHYEHDVLVTETGPRILTEGLDEIDDLVLS